MSKLREMVRLEDLAAEYQKIIGNRFNIELNANLEIDGERENGFMLATRQPYKISNVKAESLQIVLHFYTCCEDLETYNDTIQILSQLAGLNKGTFESNGKTYRYYSFLDFTRPLSEPIVDTGKFYQPLELAGTCLVTQTQGGVLIGNEVETKIKLDIGKPTEFEAIIEVLSSNTTLTKTQESPQMANAVIAKAFNNTQVYTYSYSILMLKNRVCERLLKAIKNIEPFALNEEIKITETYPSFTGDNITDTKSLVMTGANLDRNAGAFVVAEMTFQDRLDIESIYEEDGDYGGNNSGGGPGSNGGSVTGSGSSSSGGENSGGLDGSGDNITDTNTPGDTQGQYSISYDTLGNGSVLSVNFNCRASANAGDKVEFTVGLTSEGAGLEITNIRVEPEDDSQIEEFEPNYSNGVYSFDMPNTNVVVMIYLMKI